MGIHERKERERERRRQEILQAAKRVFTEKGYNGTTMEDIAKEAELSPGTLYLYFKNKDELFSSLSINVLQYMSQSFKKAFKKKRELPFDTKMEAIKNCLYDVYKFDHFILINMFHLQSSEMLDNLSPQLISEIKKLSGKSLNVMTTVFKEGISQGEVNDSHPVALADIAWGMFCGIVLWEESKSIFHQEKDFLKETLDSAFEILEKGMKKEINE